MKYAYIHGNSRFLLFFCLLLVSSNVSSAKEKEALGSKGELAFTSNKKHETSPLSRSNKNPAFYKKLNNDKTKFVAISIKGKVTDSKGEPIPGVSIKIKNTNITATTGNNGDYVINVPDENATIVFTYIGFINKEVRVGTQTVINVTLLDDQTLLTEVVIVETGFGNVEKKSDLTGSIGTVSVKDLQKAPVRSFEEALAGRVAGVQVNSSDGQPGDALNIVIRGASSINNSNSPLYVIDGLPIEDPNTNNLNPAEIETITILKDAASTAIYGSRAANGVVIITTKQGKSGKSVITYNNYFGSNITTGRVKLMNAVEFVRLQFELDSTFTNTNYFNKNGATNLPVDTLRRIYSFSDYENAESLDFQDKLFKSALFQNHFMSVSGGNEKGSRFLISGGITDQDGIIINSGFRRYQGRVNIDQSITDKIKVTANLNYANSNSNGTFPRNQESQNSLANNPGNNLLYRAWVARPTNINFDDNNLEDALVDDEAGAGVGSNLLVNPVTSAQNQFNSRTSSNFSASTITNYKISDEFNFRLNASMSINSGRAEKFDNGLTLAGLTFGPNGSLSTTQTNNFSIDNVLTYNKKFSKKSSLTLVALASQQWRKNSATGFSATNVLLPSLGIGGLPSGNIQPSFNVDISQANLLGFGTSATFNYLDKYILKGNVRADGSSKFAPGKRWGYFPSGGFAWKVSEEKFMRDFKAISNLKFRINYGETGNNRISDFAYLTPLDQTNSSGFVYNNAFNFGYYQTNLGNPDLKWETTAQFDTGLEFGVLKGKVNIEIDYYKKKTRDLLLFAGFPLSSGFTQGIINVGKTSNEGLELTLNANLISTKKFSWNSNFNISFNRNRLLELADNGQNLINRAEVQNKNPTFNYITQIGQSIGQFYGFTYLGVYQYEDFNQLPSGVYILKDNVVGPNGGVLGYDRGSVKPGDPKYKDINQDGLVDDNDQGIIGQAAPKAIGGFNNNFSYKGFSLNIFFQWSLGGQNLNYNKFYLERPTRLGLNQFASYNDRWTPTNPTNYAPRAGSLGSNVNSSRLVESSSYVRLKTAQLSYSFDPKLIQKVGLKSLALNASGQNLWTITKYSGPDPEVNTQGTGLTPAYDFSAYPRAFTFTFGLNLTF